MRNDGYYVTVDNNGEKSLCNVTYLKTIAKIKKAFNTQYENTYATLHIVKVENGIETIVYVKQFDAVRKTNWITTNRTTEKGWNDLASFEPAEEVESQPNGFKRYLCIEFEIKMRDGEYHRKYKRFDVSRETNINNIRRFSDSYIKGISGEAYIIDKVGRFYFIVNQKQYKSNADTKWSKKRKNSTCKAFVDLFIQKENH